MNLSDQQQCFIAQHSRDASSAATLTAWIESLLGEAQAPIQQEALRFEALFQRTNDAIFLIGLDGYFLEVNQRAADLLGYEVGELVGRHFTEFVMPEEETLSRSRFSEAGSGIILPLYERTFRHKDGHPIYTELNVAQVYSAEGQPLYHQSCVRDISERKAMEQSLRESEGRQRALLEALPDLMFRIRRDGTFLDYHAPRQDALFFSPDAFLGHTVDEIFPPEHAAESNALIQRVLETGEMATFDYERDGAFYEARIVTYDTDEVVVIVRDISERREWEQHQFALALEKERVKMLANFLQDAAHEFRTPLSIIQTKLYLMSKVNDPVARQARSEQIVEQVQRIAHLITMLTKMSQLDYGLPLEKTPVQLNLLVQQVVEATVHREGRTAPTVDLDLSPSLSLIAGNEELLVEAIAQIVDNAFRYTDTNGCITVQTGEDEDSISLSISDTGCGIAESELPHIFERFYRLDVAHTQPGFGLGLPIALSIIESHGGQIHVESEPNAGSTFIIYLPKITQTKPIA